METLPLWKSVLLGIIQGASEFLPISSSAHLVLTQNFLGIQSNGSSILALDASLHLGTLFAVLLAMREEIKGVFLSREGRRLGGFIILGTLPAVVIGLGLESFFESLFQNPLWAAIFLMITGMILWSTRYIRGTIGTYQELGWKKVLAIGSAQAVAILPGISRSGSTIAAGMWSHLEPEKSARFSFLLSIPAILGAFLLEIRHFTHFSPDALVATLVGTLVSFGVGYLAIRWLLRLISRGKFSYFAIYCWIVGAIAILSQIF